MWREVTEDDIYDVMMGPELDALRVAAKRTGQDDVLTSTIETTVNRVRGYIADCPTNRLAPGLTVPERVIYDLVVLVRHRVMARLEMKISDARTEEYKEAKRFFERVSECRVSLEQPEGTVVDDGNNQSIDVVRKSDRVSTREDLQGLM